MCIAWFGTTFHVVVRSHIWTICKLSLHSSQSASLFHLGNDHVDNAERDPAIILLAVSSYPKVFCLLPFSFLPNVSRYISKARVLAEFYFMTKSALLELFRKL